jgi:hypothetical protein
LLAAVLAAVAVSSDSLSYTTCKICQLEACIGRNYCQSRKARAGCAVFLEKGAASLARLSSDAKRKLLPYFHAPPLTQRLPSHTPAVC